MGGGPPDFPQGSTCLVVLRILLALLRFRIRDFHPLSLVFPVPFCYRSIANCSPLPRGARTTVWALSISLAATLEIDFSFFSSGYLDVSVHRVPPAPLFMLAHCSWYGDGALHRRVSPFRYPWITGYLHLPMAFRSLSRLSSALSAKASALRSF